MLLMLLSDEVMIRMEMLFIKRRLIPDIDSI
jgi:hypothetical protein